MKDNRIFLHLGFPKTATTMLQWRVFPKLSGVNYIGKYYETSSTSEAFNELIGCLRLDNQTPVSRRNQNAVKAAKIITHLARSKHGPILLSAEGLLGQCLAPSTIIQGRNGTVSPPKLNEVLGHLQSVFDHVEFLQPKLIITLRRQDELLSSFFAEAFMDRLSRVPQTATFQGFIEELIAEDGLIDAEPMMYSILEDACSKHFGEGNTAFLSFDLLRQETLQFSRQLGDFMSIDSAKIAELIGKAGKENVRRGETPDEGIRIRRKNLVYHLDRLKMRFIPGVSLGIGRRLGKILRNVEYGPHTFKPTDEQLARIMTFFEMDNAIFAERHPRKLDAHTK